MGEFDDILGPEPKKSKVQENKIWKKDKWIEVQNVYEQSKKKWAKYGDPASEPDKSEQKLMKEKILKHLAEEIGLYEVNEDGGWKSPRARKMVEEANDKYLREFKEKAKKEAEKND